MKKSLAPKLFVGCFCVFLAGMALLTLLLPKAASSYYENRSLAEAPEFRRISPTMWLSGPTL